MTLGKWAIRFKIPALLFAICALRAVTGAAADNPAHSTATVQEVLAPGTYQIDPPHTFAYFDARHQVVGLVRGRFDKVAGTITVAQDPHGSFGSWAWDVSRHQKDVQGILQKHSAKQVQGAR